MHDELLHLFKESHHDGVSPRQAGGSGQGQGYPHWMMDMPGGSGTQYNNLHQLHGGTFCNLICLSFKTTVQNPFFQPTPISEAPTSLPPTPQ